MRQFEILYEGRASSSSSPEGAKTTQKSVLRKSAAERVMKDIRHQTRRQNSAERKINKVRVVLRGGENISVRFRGMRSIFLCLLDYIATSALRLDMPSAANIG
jgi:hypothetical protein